MTERKPAPTTKAATRPKGAKLLRELERIESWNADRRLKGRGLPPGWDELAWQMPAEPPTSRVVLTLPAEVAEWFESLGAECAEAINAVLRLYMLGILARELEDPEHFDWRGQPV